ncbi:hypothetical protein GMA19_00818 [Paenibacillus polymyxa E681]|nr:site-specific DNA-methyltransferase [Paenibacillus polymyxa]QNV55666.1 hypothetical protein GE561_00819 [Paenibacillus polymyxa E681]QNV60502.1 hypothetical protein GMA19_00818 [Paenibacillus polymyxa E681]
MMSDKLQKFTDLMQGIFELDKSDLDFGIYRIMNIRKAEIENFLKVDLIRKVQDTLAPFASNTGDIETRIVEIERACDAVGMEVSASKMAGEYASLKAQLLAGVDMSALETDVYSALFSFFNRYYDEGDFISKRRYKEGVYAIPYEGEEVKLYWANQDQYYIKTTENFKDYTFKDGGLTVHFRLVDATTELNNNKESDDNKRVFMLYEETEERPDLKTIEQNGNELIIRLVFDVPTDKKKKYTEENAAKIVDAITKNHKEFFSIIAPRFMDSKTKRQTKSLLDKHLEAYVAKNTFDYFIHKDLHGFLTRELDFYIKSEIIHLDDLDTSNEKRVETYLAKVKAIKRVGKIIIDFLAQIEGFQKKLWLKKKFVIETNWCITLDKIDEAFYQKIIENKLQVQEWIEMYAIDEIEGDLAIVGFSDPLTIEFLRQNQNLVVDTRHFTFEFKDRLIASIDKLDELTGGLMVHGENFQALNFLLETYEKRVDAIQIDPPYNTDTSGFLYKNNYRHSSWASMMSERIFVAEQLLDDSGSFRCHIDENEYELLFNIFEQFGRGNAGTIVWNKLNPMLGRKGVATQHEYIIYRTNFDKSIFAKSENIDRIKEYAREAIEKNGGINVAARSEFAQLVKNDKSFSGGDKAYHLLDEKGIVYRLVAMGAPEKRSDPKYFIPLIHPITKKPCPVPPNGWSRKPETMLEMINNGTIIFGKDETTQPQKKVELSEDSQRQIASVLSEGKSGKAVLDHLGLEFPYAHPVSMYETLISANSPSIVLDYFAGSGTTGHAVINLNREDGCNRKYILVEMGEHFNTVTRPRMKKVVYSDNWKNGKPTSRNTGVSHIMKYIRLESYEDTLSNIQLSDKGPQMQALFGEEYLVNYMLDIEAEGSLLKLDYFKTPFEYKLKVTEKNETREKVIDLVETFNYLIGLSVARQSVVAYFNAVSDDQGAYEGAVSLDKNGGGIYAFKQVEGLLPDGRRVLIIWRNITDDLIGSNAALDAYFAKHRINPQDREFDIIYVNGDNNLENLRTDDEGWKVRMTEIDFKKHTFEGV